MHASPEVCICCVQSSDYDQERYIDVSPTPYYVTEEAGLEQTQAM